MRSQSSPKVNYSWIVIMLSILSSLFTSNSQAGPIFPRQANLSGNILQFSMQEDFSKNMPAPDMIEKLDITDLKKFDKGDYGNIIRRWWDIKNSGWFGKKLGTLMLDISVQRKIDNQAKLIHDRPYNLTDRLDFMLMLDDLFHQRYDRLNQTLAPDPGRTHAYHTSFATLVGNKLSSLQNETLANNQKWIRQSIAGPNGVTIINLAMPLDTNVFILVTFTYAPNNGIATRELIAAAKEKTEVIEQNLKVVFAANNSIGAVTAETFLTQSNNDALQQRRNEFMTLFHLQADHMLPNKESTQNTN
jgi:hypothetical protein